MNSAGFALVVPLTRIRVQMLRNGLLRAGSERRGWNTIIAIVVIGAMFMSYRFAGVVLGVTRPGSGQLEPLVAGGMVLLAGFTGVTSITFALSSLFFAKDMDMLLSAPIPPRAIVLSRVLGQLGFGVGIGVCLGGPPLIAYLIEEGALAALPLIFVVVLALVTLPLVIGTAFTLLSVRLMPARYVRDAGGLIVTVVVLAVTAANLLIHGTDSFTSGRRPAVLDFSRYGQGPADDARLPTGWAARAIVNAIHGNLHAALLWSAPLVAAALLLPPLATRLCERAFVVGYQRNTTASRGRTRARRTTAHGDRHLPQRGWIVLMVKDLRVIRRDASQLGQLLLPLVLFGVYLGRLNGNASLQNTTLPSWYSSALTAAFASLFAAAGIALRGVGSEGTRMWLLRVSPLPVRQLLIAKFLAGTVVASLLGITLLWIGEFRAGTPPLALVLPTVRLLLIIGGLVALATGMGAMWPRLDWTDPRRSVGAGVSFLFIILGSAYLTLAFVVLGVPYAIHDTGSVAVAVADAALLLMTATIGVVAMTLGAHRLRRIEL